MHKREQWGSRLGFILAAAGSAVGIGNIWKYPHMAGSNGGAAFTLVYLLCILIVGMTIVIAEFAIGRKTQLSPVGAFEKLAPGSHWRWVGFLGVASAFVILAFYGVVGGWIMKYIFIALSGGFDSLNNNPDAAKDLFVTFTESTWTPIFFQIAFMSICMFVIINGVKDGIENWSKVMMPIIVGLLFVLAIRGLTLPGGDEGLKFLFLPRFEELTASAIVSALGHAFFTLSLGMGTMITYGSYLDKEQNLLKSALWVLALDTFIAILAGIAIFTTVFALKADPAGGAGLIFFILPSVFPQLAYGSIWGFLFFGLLFMAALTSAISILEVVTAYFIDQKGWSRKKATIQFGLVITLVGVFCSLSLGGGVNITSSLGPGFAKIFGSTFFDFLDNLSSKYMLPIGGMFTALFILNKWGVNNFILEINQKILGEDKDTMLIKTLCALSALVVFFILINELVSTITGKAIVG